MSVVCKCCNARCKDTESIRCFVCDNVFANVCVGMQAAESRILRSKANLKWTCDLCSLSESPLAALKATIDDLSAQVKSLSESVARLSDERSQDVAGGSVLIDEVINEISERERRSVNVIMSGVPESEDADMSVVVQNVLKGVVESPPFAAKIFRLGKNITPGRPRLLKVVFDNKDDAQMILRRAKVLRGSNLYKNVYINRDRTVYEQQHERGLRDEIRRRTEQGESKLFLKFVNGNPTISQRKN